MISEQGSYCVFIWFLFWIWCHRGVGTRLFCSAAIVKRHYTTILEAKDGITVTLSGFINRDRAHENGFSFQVFHHPCSDSYSDSVMEMIWCCVLFDFRNLWCRNIDPAVYICLLLFPLACVSVFSWETLYSLIENIYVLSIYAVS
jgi:hypothetical protein